MLTYGEWPPSRHWGCRVTPMRARCECNWLPQTSQFSGSFGNGAIWQMMRSWEPTPADRNDGLPNHSTRQRGAAVRAGIVENRPSELSVGMLPPRQQRRYRT